MSPRLVVSIELGVVMLLCGCDERPQHAPPPIQSDSAVQPHTEDPTEPVRDAGAPEPEDSPRTPEPEDSPQTPEPDAVDPTPAAPTAPRAPAAPVPAAPMPADAGARDAATSSDGEDDAGIPDAEPDAATTEPIAPRTDGCPEDAPLPVDRVRVLARGGDGESTVGARIQGSNSSPTLDFVDLTALQGASADGSFAELRFENSQRYRYIRYYAPPGSQAGVAELEFFSGGRRLSGAPFGTANSDAQRSFAQALDGNPDTYFAPTAEGGGYVGLDIARGYITAPVRFTPAGASFSGPVEVELTSATAGAVVRYTADESEPTGPGASTYSAPILLSAPRTTLRAVASAACRFDSAIQTATYTIGSIGEPGATGLRSYHIGNSLTDTINPWLEPIADSTGVDHEYARWTIPGAPIKWLAEHPGEGYGTPEGAASFDSFVSAFAPIDHLSLQPYADPSFESQGGAAVGLLTTALRFNPQAQFWMYATWIGRTEWATASFSAGGGTVYPQWQVPKAPSNWEDGTKNALLYVEAFRDYVDARVGGKPIRVVPGGLALVELKERMDAGLVPGLGSFFATMFEDEEHLKPPAQYVVALVFYACLYGQSPVGRVTSAGTGLSSQQARILQEIAWDVASTYPGCGVQP